MGGNTEGEFVFLEKKGIRLENQHYCGDYIYFGGRCESEGDIIKKKYDSEKYDEKYDEKNINSPMYFMNGSRRGPLGISMAGVSDVVHRLVKGWPQGPRGVEKGERVREGWEIYEKG